MDKELHFIESDLGLQDINKIKLVLSDKGCNSPMLLRLVEASDIPKGDLHVTLGDLVPKSFCLSFFLMVLTASWAVSKDDPSFVASSLSDMRVSGVMDPPSTGLLVAVGLLLAPLLGRGETDLLFLILIGLSIGPS